MSNEGCSPRRRVLAEWHGIDVGGEVPMTWQVARDMQPDYYAILGVGASATAEQIKAAFRLRVKQVHPDRNPSPEATDRFIGLTEAYRVLGDVRVREIYDQARFAVVAAEPLRAAPPARRSSVRAGRARRARRRPGMWLKASCFAGALMVGCSFVIDYGADRRLMAAARAPDTRIEEASKEIGSMAPDRVNSLLHMSTAGAGAQD